MMMMMMIKNVLLLASALVLYHAALKGTFVHGHGLMTQPATRQYLSSYDPRFAYDNCPHCMNRGGFCGFQQNDFRDYRFPRDRSGNVISPSELEAMIPPELVYSSGETITVDITITAHHLGHVELKICDDPLDLSQACFDQYPMEFVSDVFYNAPKDENYPDRGYLAPNNGEAMPPDQFTTPYGEGQAYRMRFRIPDDVQCDHCVLQWTYITGNSCNSPGYSSYYSQLGQGGLRWWAPSLGDCPNPIPKGGAATDIPEQFWNCADIKIISTGGGEGGEGEGEGGSGTPPSDQENSDQDDTSGGSENSGGETQEDSNNDAEQSNTGQPSCPEPNAIFPNEDCSGFYICDAAGNMNPLVECAAGTLFSIERGYCDWAPNVNCQGDSSGSDSNTSGGNEDNGGDTQDNPSNDSSNSEEEEDSSDDTEQSNTGQPSCPEPNAIFPNEDCSGYYICDAAGNMNPLVECAAGTLFSIERGYCDWAPNVNCQGDSSGSTDDNDSNTEEEDSSNDTEQSNTGQPSCPEPNAIFPNEDCSGFYICDAAGNMNPLIECTAGTLFSIERGYCDWAPNVNCQGGYYRNTYG